MRLEWTEYISVVVSLVLSVLISVIVYRKDQKCDSEEEKNNPKFTALPVVASLIASYTSGVTLLGKPAEAYQFGISYLVFFITLVVTNMSSGFFFLPLVSKMKGSSIYQYFGLRFDSRIEKIAIFQYILSKVFAAALYCLPAALILNHFSGISQSVQIIMLISLTTAYTMIGGLKGVVWTDTFQAVIMFFSLIALIVTSIIKVGGASHVFQLAYETDRLSWIIPSFDPSQRLSIWAFLTGMNVAGVLNQAWYQRMRALETEREIKKCLLCQTLGSVVIGLGSCIMGLSIYAYYHGCDPKEAKLIESYASIVIYWLDDVGSGVPGLLGLYIAGITCASISVMSTNLNTVSTMIVDEFVSSRLSKSQTIRICTVLQGVVVMGIALVIKDANSFLELAYVFMSLEGMTSGLFILGSIFVPATTKGAMAGSVTSLVITLFLIFGTNLSGAKNIVAPFENKPMSTEFCPMNVTMLNTVKRSVVETGGVLFLFKISPFVYPVISIVSTTAVGIVVSLVFPDKDSKNESALETTKNPDLYLPCVHRFLPKVTRQCIPEVNVASKGYIPVSPDDEQTRNVLQR